MLLATPGQTATYVCSHASTSSSNNHTKTHKLSRPSYKLLDSSSSQINNTTVTSTTTTTSAAAATQSASALMKSAAALQRTNRNSGFQSVTVNNIPKPNPHTFINDNGLNCVRKSIASTASGSSNAGSTIQNKYTSYSALPSTGSIVTLKSNVASAISSQAATSSSSTSSSSSSLTKKIIISAAFLKTYTIPPTDLHRSSAARARSYSADSLYDEMCHFKPIRSVPTTPWKCGSKSRGLNIKAPKPCYGQNSTSTSTGSTEDTSAPTKVRKDLKKSGCSKAKSKIKPKLSANLFPNLKPQPSAFVRLSMTMSNISIQSIAEQQKLNLDLRENTNQKKKANVKKSTTKSTKSQPTKSKADKKEESSKKKNQNKTPKEPKKSVKPAKDVVAKNAKISNTKKRKSQIVEPKKCDSIVSSKKVRTEIAFRKTPPLTRRRLRLMDNCKLYGPLD